MQTNYNILHCIFVLCCYNEGISMDKSLSLRYFMIIFDKIKGIYFGDNNLSSDKIQRSKDLFIYEGITARTIFVLTSGAYLAGYAKLLGADDSFNGILGAVPTLAGTIQLFSPIVFERIKKRKLLISGLCFIHRLLLALMLLVPIVATDKSLRLYLLVSIYFLSYVFGTFITPAASNWLVSLTDERSRGSYLGKRDSILLAVSTVLSLVMGKVLDTFRGNNAEMIGFIFIGIVVIIFTVVNFGILSSIGEPVVRQTKEIPKLRDIFTKPLKDANFKKVIAVCVLWNIGAQIGLSFFSVYMVSGLNLSYAYITAVGTFGSIVSVLAARLWGKLADRSNWPLVTKLSIGLLAICHITWFFVCKSNVYFLMPIAQFLSGAAWGGINLGIFNIQFAYAPEEGRTMYLGFNAAIGGFIGFGVAMLGARIVSLLEGFTITFGMLTIGKMQVVFGISGILLLLCATSIGIFFKDKELEKLKYNVKNYAKRLLKN